MKNSKKIISILMILAFCFTTSVYAQDADKEAEKAAREAQKAEAAAKKAEADAQKKAEKEAQAAAKKAEKEAKMAEFKQARDEGKDLVIAAPNGANLTIPYINIVFDEGLSLTQVTRIIKQTDRTNFVFRDVMAGAYMDVKTIGFQDINPIFRIAAYTPLAMTFNYVPQKTLLTNWAVDSFLGFEFRHSMLDYVFIDITPGAHMLYQVTDRFSLLNIGAELMLTCELPIAYNWSILVSGAGSFDYGNFGSNKLAEPYDYVYQFTCDLGVRYTTKAPNKYNYLNQSEQMVKEKKDAKIAKKQAKKQANKEKAAAKKAESEQKKKAIQEQKLREKEAKNSAKGEQ
ncbi:MAG: hypothetical protein K6G52_01200 [Treponemataceae bacterium]|nr:hypothetical protein [Treponemataceae bacterium]